MASRQCEGASGHLRVLGAEGEGAIDTAEKSAQQTTRHRFAPKVCLGVRLLEAEHLREHGEVNADELLAELLALGVEDNLVEENDRIIPNLNKKEIRKEHQSQRSSREQGRT